MKTKKTLLLTTYICMVSLLAAFTGTLNAQTIHYVKPAASGSGNGSSWANASADIQGMIDASAVGDQVWIAGGTYSIGVTLEMKNGVNVYGGFAGTETAITARAKSDLDGNRTVEDWEFTNATVLDGQNAIRVLDQANPFAMETVWDGLSITKGSSTEGAGAYIRTNGKLLNCIVMSSGGNTTGGGIYNNGGTVSYCDVSRNSTSYFYGGGIYNNGGTVNNCTVSGNTNSSYGGGIFIYGGTVSNCTVSGNTSIAGGGIYNNGGTVNNCTVSDNTSSSYGGGGICCENTTNSIVNDCIVENNKADNGQGGGIFQGIVARCIVKGNSAAIGGGLYQSITNNCLLLNNNATGSGGGAYYGSAVNCTFVGNMATGQGGGMYAGTAINCIFWINNANTGFQIYNGSVTYSAVQEGFSGEGNINITSNNEDGGAMFVNPTAENYQLSPCSPCLNAGSNSAVSNPATATDLAGNARIYQYSTNGIVDIGAYELQSASGNFAVNITSSIQGNDMILGTNAIPNATYLWNTGATTSTITATAPGDYSVTVTNASGCTATAVTTVAFLSETICDGDSYDFYGQAITQKGVYSTIDLGNTYKLTLTVLPSPPVPTITQNDLTLTSSSSANNQWWYSDGYSDYEPITGATGQTYQCAQSGLYQVVVSNTNGCSSSAEISIAFIPNTEMTALKAIYQSTNGDSWTFPWDINNPYSVGNWYGVFVVDGHVYEIDLSNNNLTGTLPANLGSLPYLEYFDVRHNKIGGNLPTNISGVYTSSFFYNFEMFFSDNIFTGSIPSCYNIQDYDLLLDVSNNRLSSLEVPLNKSNVSLNINNQEIWSGVAVQINPGMDAIISLPNICTYNHNAQNFSATPTFSVYLEDDNIGTATVSDQGIVIIPAIMLANAIPGAALTLIQSTGDAQGTKIHYNQGANPGIYSIKGTVTQNGNPLSGVTIMYDNGYSVTYASGSYIVTVDQNATVTLTPSLSGYTFSPSSITCSNVTSNLTGKDFTATSASGINEISAQQIKLYPNPVENELFITSEEPIEKVEIYNGAGVMVMRENNFAGKINISSLSNGLYIVKVYINGSAMVRKVIKK